ARPHFRRLLETRRAEPRDPFPQGRSGSQAREASTFTGAPRQRRSPAVTQVILKAGHVQPVWAGHPWIFAQGIEKVRGKAESGSEVEVQDARGNVLGRGLYSPHSAIAVRLYTRDGSRSFDESLVEERLRAALARRQRFGLPNQRTSGFRAFHGEGD